MTYSEDNPLAFPTPETAENYGCDGMTLRDYFAGQALVAAISAHNGGFSQTNLAHWSYGMADEMLRERAK